MTARMLSITTKWFFGSEIQKSHDYPYVEYCKIVLKRIIGLPVIFKRWQNCNQIRKLAFTKLVSTNLKKNRCWCLRFFFTMLLIRLYIVNCLIYIRDIILQIQLQELEWNIHFNCNILIIIILFRYNFHHKKCEPIKQ